MKIEIINKNMNTNNQQQKRMLKKRQSSFGVYFVVKNLWSSQNS